MEKFCQSCAMPLTQDNVAKEINGQKSDKYCNLCYANGKFINPNITYDQMLKLGLDGIDKSKNSKIKKWIFKKSYPALLKKCKRWE